MSKYQLSPLDAFDVEVMVNISTGAVLLDVVDVNGEHPVVVALDSEHLSTLMHRIAMIGGFANVFSQGEGIVRQVNVIPAESALYSGDADDMTGTPPSGAVTVGAYLDYVATQKHGVIIPAVILHVPVSAVQNAREVAFAT